MGGVVKPLYQLNHRRFPTATLPDQGQRPAGGDLQIEILEDQKFGAGRVGKGHVLQFDVPLDMLHLDPIFFAIYFGGVLNGL